MPCTDVGTLSLRHGEIYDARRELGAKDLIDAKIEGSAETEAGAGAGAGAGALWSSPRVGLEQVNYPVKQLNTLCKGLILFDTSKRWKSSTQCHVQLSAKNKLNWPYQAVSDSHIYDNLLYKTRQDKTRQDIRRYKTIRYNVE